MSDPPLRVMSYNIFEGGAGREAALLAVIRAAQPDLLFLQEVLSRESAERLGAALGMHSRFAESNARTRNVALLSRWPLHDCHTFHPFPLLRTLLLATVQPPGCAPLHCFGLHLGLIHEMWRTLEVATILRRIRHYQQGQPTPYALLAGDFNALPPGDPIGLRRAAPLLRTVLALQFRAAPRLALRLVRRAGWVDSFRHCHPHAAGWTMPAPRPAVRLDYLFVSPALLSHVATCQVVEHPHAPHASDHLPVLLTLHRAEA